MSLICLQHIVKSNRDLLRNKSSKKNYNYEYEKKYNIAWW